MLCCSCLLLAHWKTHSRHYKGARGGSCEPCQESKEVIKLYIVDYTGPLSALLDDLFNNIIASPPSLAPWEKSHVRQETRVSHRAEPRGLARCPFFVRFVLEPIQREPQK